GNGSASSRAGAQAHAEIFPGVVVWKRRVAGVAGAASADHRAGFRPHADAAHSSRAALLVRRGGARCGGLGTGAASRPAARRVPTPDDAGVFRRLLLGAAARAARWTEC